MNVLYLNKGFYWPAMSTLWVTWTPNAERTKMVGASTSGCLVGNIVGLSFGGYLCSNGFDGGWPSIFYIFGLLDSIERIGMQDFC